MNEDQPPQQQQLPQTAIDEVDRLMFKKLDSGEARTGEQLLRPTEMARPAKSRSKSIPVNELRPGGRSLAAATKRKPPKSPVDGQQQQQQLPSDVQPPIQVDSGCGKQDDDEDDDDVVSCTTTSEVNSNDDAVSIASRLSQLVYEQEVKLHDHRQQASPHELGMPPSSQSAADLTSRECEPRTYNTDMKQHVQSSNDLHGPSKHLTPAHMGQDQSRTFSLNELNFDSKQQQQQQVVRTPQIQVNSQPDNQYSQSDIYNDQTYGMKRNMSASNFLPERGDLRSLESNRQTASDENGLQQHRMRSNTVGGGRPMLNIQRSAWTLSDFDQTFNNQEKGQEGGGGGGEWQTPADLVDASSELAGLQNAPAGQPLKTGFERQTRGQKELLMKASRNALLTQLTQQQQQQQQQVASPTTGGANLSLAAPGPQQHGRRHSLSRQDSVSSTLGAFVLPSGRRPSRTHSIGSFASSCDSFKPKGLLSGAKRRIMAAANSNKSPDEGEKKPSQSNSSCFCCNYELFKQYLPILEWLPRYSLKQDLLPDLTAGLAVAVLNISTSLSAAVVAGTDLVVAFRSSIINTFVYALLCSSKHTSFGSWSIMSQMLLISVRRALSDELILKRIDLGPSASWEPEEYEMWHMNIIIMYTFLIGLVQLVSGLLNLGNILASFIPEALCSSMIAATAFTMAIGQLANMCGTTNKVLWAIEKNTTELWADLKNPPVDITDVFAGLFRWIKQIVLLIKYYEQINLICVFISIACVLLLAFNQYFLQVQLKRHFKRNIFVPSELILLILMIIISYALDLSGQYQVATCGPIYIDIGLPSIPNLRLFREMWFDSLATALISFTMVYIMAKTYSNKLNYEIDCNQELIACGAGNLIGGLFDALPATASFSRTAGQVEAGGRTQMASIINCVVLVGLAQLFGHHVAVLPVCVMSATLFYGFARMMTRTGEVFIYWRICKVDFAIWMVTFVAILTLDMVNGFLYGFIFSILTMLYRAQNRRCYLLGSIIGTSDVYVPLAKYPLAREMENIKIFQFCGPIHYVSADIFERLLRQKTRVNVKEILNEMESNKIQNYYGEKPPLNSQKTINSTLEKPYSSSSSSSFSLSTTTTTTTATATPQRPQQQLPLASFNPRDRNLPTHIILDFSMISFIDSAGIHVIKKIIEDHDKVNVTIFLASLASHVASVVKSEPSLWLNYKQRFYVTLADAVHCAMRDSQQLQIQANNNNIICQQHFSSSKNSSRPQQNQRSMSIISINSSSSLSRSNQNNKETTNSADDDHKANPIFQC